MTDLFDHARHAHQDALRLPDICGERCVHSLIDTASCQACVDVCPHDAWQLDEEQLGIDAERCDGCLQCVAVCPQGAITASLAPATRRDDRGRVALFACRRSGVTTDEGIIPCLHALGIDALLSLYRAGTRSLRACSGDCAGCDRGPVQVLQKRIVALNRMLASRDLGSLDYRELDPEDWQAELTRSLPRDPGPSVSRRQFFRRGLSRLIEESDRGGDANPAAADGSTPGDHLPPPKPGGIVPFLPAIDRTACTACDACVRLCPNEAINTFTERDPPAEGYRIRADRCSGCGICIDVCDRNAITLTAWGRVPHDGDMPLHPGRCRSCGNPFRYPAVQTGAPLLCPICRQHDHQRLLYQVLD